MYKMYTSEIPRMLSNREMCFYANEIDVWYWVIEVEMKETIKEKKSEAGSGAQGHGSIWTQLTHRYTQTHTHTRSKKGGGVLPWDFRGIQSSLGSQSARTHTAQPWITMLTYLGKQWKRTVRFKCVHQSLIGLFPGRLYTLLISQPPAHKELVQMWTLDTDRTPHKEKQCHYRPAMIHSWHKAVLKLHNDQSTRDLLLCEDLMLWPDLKAEPRVREATHADLCSSQQASWITSLSWCICHLPADTATSYKPVSSTSCDLQHGPTTETSPQFSVCSDKTEASWEL